MQNTKDSGSGAMRPVFIKAFDIPDAWFQCLYKIMEYGYEYTITRGSYEGQKRKEFDFVTVQITNPGHRPLVPEIPASFGIPPPTTDEYIQEYLSYLMTDEKKEGEDYTYGERIVNPKVRIKENVNGKEIVKEIPLGVNPLQEIINIYKRGGYGTNQATLEIGMPSDITLHDPPCLRLIDTRVRYGKLHFIIYFRSWDLWAGFPSNLGGLQQVKEYVADAIGVEDGEMILVSKGLHLYDYVWDIARMRVYKADKEKEGSE
jgi:thymidylate synthase